MRSEQYLYSHNNEQLISITNPPEKCYIIIMEKQERAKVWGEETKKSHILQKKDHWVISKASD